jgi:hypothetical protein
MRTLLTDFSAERLHQSSESEHLFVNTKVMQGDTQPSNAFPLWPSLLLESRNLVSLAAFIVAALPSLLLFFYWQLHRGYYPTFDQADSIVVAQRIAHVFTRSGVHEGFSALYNFRSFKTIILPVYFVPFLIASGGKVFPAVIAGQTVQLFAFLLYCFAFLRQGGGLKPAALGIFFLSSLPWLLSAAYGADSDFPYLLCAVAFALHFERCDLFRNRFQATIAGLFLAFAVCLRPAESVIFFAIPIAVGLRRAYSRKIVGMPALLVTLPLIPLAIAYVVYLGRHNLQLPDAEVFVFIPFVLPLALFLPWKRLKLSSGYLLFFGVGCCFPLFWFIPFSAALWNWLLLGVSSGMLERVVSLAPRQSRFSFFQLLYGHYFGTRFFLLAVIALSSYFLGRIFKKWEVPLTAWPFALSFIFLIAAGANTSNGSLRYYLTASFFVYFLALSCALNFRAPLFRLRASLVFLIALGQLVFISNDLYILNIHFPALDDVLESKFSSQQSYGPGPDPKIKIEGAVNDALSRERGLHVVGVLWLSSAAEWGEYLDAPALSVIAEERSNNLRFDTLQFVDTTENLRTQEEALGWLRKNYDYFLIAPVRSTLKSASAGIHPMEKAAALLGAHFLAGTLSETGFKLVSHFAVNVAVPGAGEMLLLRSMRKN